MELANTKRKFNSAMIGMILGDSSMTNNHSMYIRHGGKQLDYVDEKVEYLKNYIYPSSVRQKMDNKGYVYRYAFYSDYCMKYLYNSIYKYNGTKYVKSINSHILNRFDKISLAFLYMDDGCLSVRKRNGKYTKSIQIILNTQGFTLSENEKLQSMLKNKFDLDFRIARDKNNYRLWCNTANALKMLEIVSPVVKNFKSMHYKLDVKRDDISFI